MGCQGRESRNVRNDLEVIEFHFSFFIYTFFSKDVRLPVQLQRAMAAEAEAAREARAKVSWADNF